MDGVIALQGGLRVGGVLVRDLELRELSGIEEDILSDQRRAEGGKGELLKPPSQRITEVLARCTVRAGDVRCEDNRDPAKASLAAFEDVWAKALAGDRSLAVVLLRRLSLGDSYVFSQTCPECKKEIKRVSADLSTLTFSPYFGAIKDEAKRDELLLAEQHTLSLPSGKTAEWRLFRKDDEDRLTSMLREHPEQLMTAVIAAHLLRVDGKDSSLERVQLLSARDRAFMRNYFDEVEGGLDTQIDIVCPNPECGHAFTRKLDVGKTSFFFPSGTT